MRQGDRRERTLHGRLRCDISLAPRAAGLQDREARARYKRGATNTKEACDRAIAASGLSTEAFVAKYRSLLIAPTKSDAPKPTATPKPTTAPKLDTSDPKVRECLAKYEALKTLKTGDPKTFEAALSTFKQTCTTVLGMRG
ncbi:MAG: hypothetical protein E6I14_09795 [Chloroflexi bacterium]|nr:MAG: hypothetical protein E6I14_09795 [Chloroflexota bacterium]